MISLKIIIDERARFRLFLYKFKLVDELSIHYSLCELGNWMYDVDVLNVGRPMCLEKATNHVQHEGLVCRGQLRSLHYELLSPRNNC